MTPETVGVSVALGVELGPLMDVALHDEVCLRASALMMPAHRDHYLLFGSGWNGVGVRLKAAGLHADEFQRLFSSEPASSTEEKFEQDARFFDCIANATAAAENAVFAAYLLSVFPTVPHPMDKALKQPRDQMVEQVSRGVATGILGQFLKDSFSAPEAAKLYELRDYLLHRGRPSRNHFVGGDFDGKATIARNLKAHSSQWQNDLVFDSNALNTVLRWLTLHCGGVARLMLRVMP